MSNDDPLQAPALKVIQGRMSDQSLPPAVQENIRQHYDNLTRVADNLKTLGMAQQAIDEHVLEIFKEYERELAANIERIKDAEEARRNDQVG